MTKYDFPIEGRCAEWKGSEFTQVDFIFSVYDENTDITWYVFEERGGSERLVIDGDDELMQIIDVDPFGVFNFIVNHDNCEHELHFMFTSTEKARTEKYWKEQFYDWCKWVENGCKGDN